MKKNDLAFYVCVFAICVAIAYLLTRCGSGSPVGTIQKSEQTSVVSGNSDATSTVSAGEAITASNADSKSHVTSSEHKKQTASKASRSRRTNKSSTSRKRRNDAQNATGATPDSRSKKTAKSADGGQKSPSADEMQTDPTQKSLKQSANASEAPANDGALSNAPREVSDADGALSNAPREASDADGALSNAPREAPTDNAQNANIGGASGQGNDVETDRASGKKSSEETSSNDNEESEDELAKASDESLDEDSDEELDEDSDEAEYDGMKGHIVYDTARVWKRTVIPCYKRIDFGGQKKRMKVGETICLFLSNTYEFLRTSYFADRADEIEEQGTAHISLVQKEDIVIAKIFICEKGWRVVEITENLSR